MENFVKPQDIEQINHNNKRKTHSVKKVHLLITNKWKGTKTEPFEQVLKNLKTVLIYPNNKYNSMSTNKDISQDCKMHKLAAAQEAKDIYRLLESNILQYNRRSNKQTILYWEEKNKLFKKLQRLSTLKKELTKSDNLKPKIESKLQYYSKKIQLCNEYETLHLTDIYSIKSFNEWLNKKQDKNLKEYSMIDVSAFSTSTSKNHDVATDKTKT